MQTRTGSSFRVLPYLYDSTSQTLKKAKIPISIFVPTSQNFTVAAMGPMGLCPSPSLLDWPTNLTPLPSDGDVTPRLVSSSHRSTFPPRVP